VQFVPWQNIADWHCKACGYCCKLYSVVINANEWLSIAQTFGIQNTVATQERFLIKRDSDGSCAFLCKEANTYCCKLQNGKPQACKIWPFKILSEPKYGEANKAAYNYGGVRLYVYGDTMCSGLREGEPTWEFRNIKIKEFTELALGLRDMQCRTTRPAAYRPVQQWGRQLFP
jgi:Fe-S-cluster containining protein